MASDVTTIPSPLLSRREAASFVSGELGLPLAYGTLARLCSQGEGPPPSLVWGGQHRYEREHVRKWALKRAKAKGARA